MEVPKPKKGWLVIWRKQGQTIVIDGKDGRIEVTIGKYRGSQTQLAIQSETDVKIFRKESDNKGNK
jgi:sRNA-binding carbon storage regulator CsrA